MTVQVDLAPSDAMLFSQALPKTMISRTAASLGIPLVEHVLEVRSDPLEQLRQAGAVRAGFRPITTDLDVLRDATEDYLLQSSWGGPCEDMFTYLAEHEPRVLLNIVRSGGLEPGFLSTAAEIIGQINDPDQVVPLLLDLTRHAYPMVREGAVFGLARFLDREDARHCLQHLAQGDSSPGVRASAQEVLED